MNAIFFATKRAFHGCLRITRLALKHQGLTAARFDMLFSIWRHPHGLFQRALRGQLGVSAPTISRMLRSLEQLGLVRRTRSTADRRQLHVSLTAEGNARILAVSSLFVDRGAAQLAVDCALVGPACHDESRCMIEMAGAEGVLDRLRAAFGDVARLYYPWHPDD
jgi:DNA-binding MarR family transcriptional regulator